MIDLSDLTFEDHLIVQSAVENFLEDGFDRHTDDRSVISANRKTAKSLLKLFKTKNPKLNAEHFRVIYSAVLDLRDDCKESFSLGHRDEELFKVLSTCNKLIPRFQDFFDSI